MMTLQARFLAGPTASGKTAIAQHIAETDGSAILSADAMLVYAGMDIGTATPTPAECGNVPYGGMNLVTPDQDFSVGAYRRHALEKLRGWKAGHRDGIVVGGTGLYIKSLSHGLDDGPPSDPARRSHWESVWKDSGIEGLAQALRTRAPALYEALPDPGNPRRLMRALERADAGIQAPPRSWSDPPASAPMAALRLPRDLLKSRIESRVIAMYAQGLLDEVVALRSRYDALSSTAAGAIGYAEAADVIDGVCSREEAQQRTISRTWQLARRQMTWLRGQADVRWIDVDGAMTMVQVAGRVCEHWRKHGPTGIIG
jgi:tRNA dimethylallyltransferase